MIVLVIGGSGSGKSEYAENLAVSLRQDSPIYIATMEPLDEESRLRIGKHQAMRKDKDFTTIECFTGLNRIMLPKDSTVLLECMSNLVANEMFSPTERNEGVLERIKHGIEKLTEQSEHLILVTNNVFEDGCPYDSGTIEYLKVLGTLNQWAGSISNQVIEVVHGIPIFLKSGNLETGSKEAI